MAYEKKATTKTPALIIYVLDVSASMAIQMGEKRRIDVVTDALQAAFKQMISYSTKGIIVAPRYRIGMLAYSDHVYDLLDGIRPVDQVALMGVPELNPLRSTDTAKAFEYVELLLKREMHNLADCPAPLICHLTDGEYTGVDPTPIGRRIMGMKVPDGNVLVENIFISDDILDRTILDPLAWPGILKGTKLKSAYAEKLRSISSVIPRSYQSNMRESGYHVSENAYMMLPGINPELVKMGFVLSTSTMVAR